jgi:hypothetical protein
MAAVEAGVLTGIDGLFDMTSSTSQYVPNMANYERYRAARERQARLEQTLAFTGEFV